MYTPSVKRYTLYFFLFFSSDVLDVIDDAITNNNKVLSSSNAESLKTFLVTWADHHSDGSEHLRQG